MIFYGSDLVLRESEHVETIRSGRVVEQTTIRLMTEGSQAASMYQTLLSLLDEAGYRKQD